MTAESIDSTGEPTTRGLIRAALSFHHLGALTGSNGIFEHARHSSIRPEHGHCTDDNARLAILVTRAWGVRGLPAMMLERLRLVSTSFVLESVADDGLVRNRRHLSGRWLDEPELGDSWGRAVHALGAIAASQDGAAGEALASFERAAIHRSRHLRSMAHAALGAGAVLERQPGNPIALDLLSDTADLIWSAPASADWPWPEEKLTYANAMIPEALIVAASALGRHEELIDALSMLRWLAQVESIDGHLSPTPVGGRGRGETGPGFDQQPIEVAAVASAAVRAAEHHADPVWDGLLRSAVGWFLGDNDSSHPMIDHRTGGGYDGLHVDGVNLNQGAESTIAMTETMVLATRSVRRQ